MPTYEEEQAKLKGEAGLDDLEDIPDQQYPEINPVIYKDVEPVLFKGFIYAPAVVGDSHVVFKSLNHHEFELLSILGDEGSVLFLAYSCLFIDGSNCLTDRSKVLPLLKETFGGISDSLRQHLVLQLGELNRRARMATELTEAYAQESYSRIRWAQTFGLDLSSTAVSGIVGTETLGLNYAQLTWRALNYYQDIGDEAERSWENAKFIASASAGKGMQKVYNEDKRRRRREADDRWARKDSIIKRVVFGKEASSQVIRDGQVILAPRTVEDLKNQMKADLSGERDWHDNVVAEYEQRVKSGLEEAERRWKQLQQQALEKKPSLSGSTSQIPLSRQAVMERVSQRQADLAKRLATPSLPDMDRINEVRSRLAQKGTK